MDLQRLIPLLIISFTLMLLWQAWERDYGAPPTLTTHAERADNPDIPEGQAQQPERFDGPAVAVPDGPLGSPPGQPAGASTPEEGVEGRQGERGRRIVVRTDLLEAEIDLNGGNLHRIDLLQHAVDSERLHIPFRLLSDAPDQFHIAQTGLKGAPGMDGAYFPAHQAHFTALQEGDALHMDATGELRIPLLWRDAPQGLRVVKTWIFRRDSYVAEVEYAISNHTGREWRGGLYGQLQRAEPDQEVSSAFIYTYTGGVIYSEESRYKKIDFDQMGEANLDQPVREGWAAMIQHYFLAATIPPVAEGERGNRLYTYRPAEGRYAIGAMQEAARIADGAEGRLATRFFIGPKLQDRLEKVAPGLRLTVDYGWLTVLAQPLFWMLKHIHAVVGNWGAAIILLTLLIKLVFYKLSETSYKSMARMRKLTPRLKEIKERYGKDRPRQQEAMMKLYREEKVNPMGGCLPILVQIPVFIALYWMLLESVEMRQAPFMLWIQDLSSKDPYFVLPLLMGISMFVQQRLNPAPIDPIQQKVMMCLPVVFTVFFAFFPSGLVLYWVVNNILSIAQQWYITNQVIGQKK